MDRNEEDMRNIGFFGIFKQSFKTIFTFIKIFTQITLTFIFPFTLIFLALSMISNRFFHKIAYSYLNNYNYKDNYRNITVSAGLYYWLSKLVYCTFVTVFSLPATGAIIFTVASVYTDRDVVFRHVFKIFPRIWKRLGITSVFIYLAMFLYNFIFGAVIFITTLLFGYSTLNLVIILILVFLYVSGFLYLSVVWQLASVITVLENNQGSKAMRKGKDLLYGKKKSGMGISLVLFVFLVGLMMVYEVYAQYGDEIFARLAMIWRVMIGISCCLVLMMVYLLFMVTQTILYLVCKSYHREAIDKLSLSTFLSAYTVSYTTPEEIELGRAEP